MQNDTERTARVLRGMDEQRRREERDRRGWYVRMGWVKDEGGRE